jgi:hypothetical protein
MLLCSVRGSTRSCLLRTPWGHRESARVDHCVDMWLLLLQSKRVRFILVPLALTRCCIVSWILWYNTFNVQLNGLYANIMKGIWLYCCRNCRRFRRASFVQIHGQNASHGINVSHNSSIHWILRWQNYRYDFFIAIKAFRRNSRRTKSANFCAIFSKNPISLFWRGKPLALQHVIDYCFMLCVVPG